MTTKRKDRLADVIARLLDAARDLAEIEREGLRRTDDRRKGRRERQAVTAACEGGDDGGE